MGTVQHDVDSIHIGIVVAIQCTFLAMYFTRCVGTSYR